MRHGFGINGKTDGNVLTQKGSSGPHSLSISVTAWRPGTTGEWFIFRSGRALSRYSGPTKARPLTATWPNRRTSHRAATGLSRLRGRTPEPERQTDRPVTGNTPRRLRSEAEVDGEASTGGCFHVRGGAYALATPVHGCNVHIQSDSRKSCLDPLNKAFSNFCYFTLSCFPIQQSNSADAGSKILTHLLELSVLSSHNYSIQSYRCKTKSNTLNTLAFLRHINSYLVTFCITKW